MFDSVQTYYDLDVDGINNLFIKLQQNEVQPWLKSGSKGTLLIFFYWMGYWAKTNGEQVYTCKGELLDLDQRTIALSTNQRVYTIQWVEMGLERSLKHVSEDTFECSPEVY